MTHCFLSYKREDRPRIRSLIDALRADDIAIFWDLDIPAGERWRERIGERLDSASCVLVAWTTASVAPDAGTFVHDEAQRALARGVLLPIRLDHVTPPLGFGEIQSVDLAGWEGDRKDPRWLHLMASIRAIQEGRPRPPQPRVRPKRGRLAVGALALGAAMVPLAGGLVTASHTVCAAPALRPICRALGVGSVRSAAEEAAWKQALSQRARRGYRDYLGRFPNGAFAQEAQSRLAACHDETTTTWSPIADELPLVTLAGLADLPDADAARAAHQPEVTAAMETVCAPYRKYGPYRNLTPRLDESGWRCEPIGRRVRCHFDGKVTCAAEKRIDVPREVCP